MPTWVSGRCPGGGWAWGRGSFFSFAKKPQLPATPGGRTDTVSYTSAVILKRKGY